MAWPLVAAAAISAVGAYQSSRQQAAAHRADAQAREQQAASFMQRFELSTEFTRIDGQKFAKTQQAAFAKGGVALGSGVTVTAIQDTAFKIERKIEIDRMEAEAQRDAILAGASVSRQNAAGAEQAGTFRAIGFLAQAAAGSGS